MAGDQPLVTFDAPILPEPRNERAPERDSRKSGQAAPPNIKSRATQIVAEVPVVVTPTPSVLTVAPVAADQRDRSSGATVLAGPGTGAGGQGDGFGAGGLGDGEGAGDPGATAPVQIRGRLRKSDFPSDLAEAGINARVAVLFRVERNGRVSKCEIEESSGIARVDALTCQLIQTRFKFKPSRDRQGRATPAYVAETHEWIFTPD